MAICPICGKENNNDNFVYEKLIICSPCNPCKARLQCLTTPVSDDVRNEAQNWAKEIIETKYNPPATDTLRKIYSMSMSAPKKINTNNVLTETASSPGTSSPDASSLDASSLDAKVSIKNTRTVKTLCYISIALSAIIGAFTAGGIDDDLIILGLILGLLVGALLSAFTMMFVEMSENIAINAKASLHTEQLLEEIKNELKNSEK